VLYGYAWLNVAKNSAKREKVMTSSWGISTIPSNVNLLLNFACKLFETQEAIHRCEADHFSVIELLGL